MYNDKQNVQYRELPRQVCNALLGHLLRRRQGRALLPPRRVARLMKQNV